MSTELAEKRQEAIAELLDMLDELESTVAVNRHSHESAVPRWLSMRVDAILKQHDVVNETYGVPAAVRP